MCKDAVSNHGETVFIAKLALRNGLNVFHNFIETGVTDYYQTNDPGFFQGTSEIYAAAVTTDTEELVRNTNEEEVAVTNISNILDVTSAKDIYWLKNAATTYYNPMNFIHSPPLIVRIFVDKISSSCKDTKAVVLKVIK